MINTHTYTCTDTQAYICTWMHVCVHTYIRRQTDRYIHTAHLQISRVTFWSRSRRGCWLWVTCTGTGIVRIIGRHGNSSSGARRRWWGRGLFSSSCHQLCWLDGLIDNGCGWQFFYLLLVCRWDGLLCWWEWLLCWWQWLLCWWEWLF